ncbi:hypothetical protein [Ilumatobacter sp.]|uniref:hypothetical protein n=1 Tax=Ilumatobacter sp. TaxID=1967498 RepID=UPI003C6ECAB8
MSAWTDQEAITAFVTSDAHIAVMNKYRNRMAGSHFHTWTETQPTHGRPTWDNALDRYETTVDSAS